MKRLIVAVLTASLLLTGCSGGNEVFPEVLGTWEQVYSDVPMPTFAPAKRSYKRGSGYYEFKENGTALIPVTPDEDGNARSVECQLTATAYELTVEYNGIALISGRYSLNGKKLTVYNDATRNSVIFVKTER